MTVIMTLLKDRPTEVTTPSQKCAKRALHSLSLSLSLTNICLHHNLFQHEIILSIVRGIKTYVIMSNSFNFSALQCHKAHRRMGPLRERLNQNRNKNSTERIDMTT